MLSINIIATIAKLIGSITIFCAGIPIGNRGIISTWPYKCYAWVRVSALCIFIWGWIINLILSIYGITDSSYYDDPAWGFCTFCY